MSASLLTTQVEEDEPSAAGSLSLVFIGSAEDNFLDAGRVFPIEGNRRIRFGRALAGGRIFFEQQTHGARVGIPFPWVSGEHCQLDIEWGPTPTVSLKDLQSRNGTLVENRPIVGSSEIRPGEIIEIGRTFWTLREGTAPDSEPAVPTNDSLYEPLYAAIGSTLAGVAASDVPVVIVGEAGTGKERLGRALHEWSGRSGKFVPVRLAAYEEEDLARALVGDRRSSVPSFVEQAEGGTLFLTDVADVPLRTQSRLRSLLSQLLEGRGRDDQDIRLVSATPQDLRTLVNQRRFRPELYSRLAGVELTLPPLRACRDRLGAIIRRYADQHPDTAVSLSTKAFRFALSHRWPYNVRELRHALTAAQSVAQEGGRINLAALEEVLRDGFDRSSLSLYSS